MRAILVFVVLGLIYLLVRYSTDVEIDLSEVNPVLLGYGALFASGIVVAELMRPLLGMMSTLSRFVTVAVLAAVVWLAFETARETGVLPDELLAEKPAKGSNAPPSATLELAFDGVFRTVVQINRMSVAALVDSGTPRVVLQYEEAERLGLQPERLQYTLRLPVADRKITAAPYTFLSVRIDNVETFDVEGAIAEPGGIEANLVGLSFLQNLSGALLMDGTLTLMQ